MNTSSHDDSDVDDCDASDILEYFETSNARSPHDEYERGAECVRRWQVLRLRDTVTQAEFGDLMLQLEDIDSAGSAYAHLWAAVRNWGYSLGLLVPREPPPHLTGSSRTAVCIANAGFEGQINVGATYDVIDVDPSRSLVRIRNDEHKNRWYPVRHFEFSTPPERQYVRSPDW